MGKYTTLPPAHEINSILHNLPTDGASFITAQANGLPDTGKAVSAALIQMDLPILFRDEDAHQAVSTAAQRLGLPSRLLVAIMSRETRCGAALDKNWEGDRGRGYGLMQVDKRFFVPDGYDLLMGYEKKLLNIQQGGRVLIGNYRRLVDLGYKSDPLIWHYAISAYNCGVGTLPWTAANRDYGTANEDYGSDVIARFQSIS